VCPPLCLFQNQHSLLPRKYWWAECMLRSISHKSQKSQDMIGCDLLRSYSKKAKFMPPYPYEITKSKGTIHGRHATMHFVMLFTREIDIPKAHVLEHSQSHLSICSGTLHVDRYIRKGARERRWRRRFAVRLYHSLGLQEAWDAIKSNSSTLLCMRIGACLWTRKGIWIQWCESAEN
jgi:hypothetical protein